MRTKYVMEIQIGTKSKILIEVLIEVLIIGRNTVLRIAPAKPIPSHLEGWQDCSLRIQRPQVRHVMHTFRGSIRRIRYPAFPTANRIHMIPTVKAAVFIMLPLRETPSAVGRSGLISPSLCLLSRSNGFRHHG